MAVAAEELEPEDGSASDDGPESGDGPEPADGAAPRRRSRLSAEREQELFDGVVVLLHEVGYEALTMERVAALTKSSKATLYRRWGGKPELVAQAIRNNRRVDLASIDTGSLAGDLHLMVELLSEATAQDADLMRAVAHAAGRNEDLAAALRSAMADREARTVKQALARAVARGEVAPGNPAGRFVQHMMLGAVLARFVLEGVEVDGPYLHEFVDAVVLPALSGRPAPTGD
ncbi:TetR/AcrR family transcriptional regulator [Kitasatospora viridis]|uniref:TetR family transcriptional regulator n=1 Tax=Kitasatospora viridis TaxID=281105 RepID=A0A561TST1_9ACTN|nr:TetR/AcrR family transcriptional regulator [Kitasatospora viridis]TWF90161.1 TetR family transcriptional regulator [Kitasatospora viridis]